MQTLTFYMNDYLVGYFTQHTSGVHEFRYDSQWLATKNARPISLSLPLQQAPFRDAQVVNFFDNLLPDNPTIRDKIVARYQLDSTQTFQILAEIGRDSVGALSLMPTPLQKDNKPSINYEKLSEDKLERILLGYQAQAPLGMIEELDDFRISIAGAQEKTALLKINNSWCLPLGNTPTTHIIKLPIGQIQTHAHSIDLSLSVENEYLCLKLAEAFGFAVPSCEILQTQHVKALAISRFDRKYNKDTDRILRLPQEDYCQVFGLPSARKYESDQGPTLVQIMKHLQGSTKATKDRETFMRTQVLFFLLGAIDGHAKNFSVFIEPKGGYHLTPLYDIISAYPLMGGTGLHLKDLKLAMSLKGSKGKKWHIQQIFRRHFINTARAAEFSATRMDELIHELCEQVDSVITSVQKELPKNFPPQVSEAIFTGMRQRKRRLLHQPSMED